MSTSKGHRRRIQKASKDLQRRLLAHVDGREPLCVIKAPPGSGKTHTLMHAVDHALDRDERVAVAAQTNAQCDDICRRLLERSPRRAVWRFGASGSEPPPDLAGRALWVTNKSDLPQGPCLVVGTSAKWSMVEILFPFDFLFVDEAWQMTWADFMLLGQVAPRFVLIGDPGQIPPVVPIPVHRWETSPRAPHEPAPAVIMADPTIDKLALDLNACRRLPADSVDLVRPFYDFPFDAWALPAERYVKFGRRRGGKRPADGALDILAEGAASILALRTPPEGPPLEYDVEIAALAAEVALRALERKSVAVGHEDEGETRLRPEDIGIAATHRVMNSAIMQALPSALRDQNRGIRVDTPERWQGLERKLMVVVHPLSGVLNPSAFDLETGRLCVMVSRHRSGLVVVSRDHVPATLESHIPSAEQAVGRPDVTGRGHAQHLQFWSAINDRGAVVPARR